MVAKGSLRAHADCKPAQMFIIATPTPIREDKSSDISYVESAARSLAPALAPGNLVVIESTCPVGTTQAISELLAGLRPDLTFPHQRPEKSDIHLAYCPERVLPGNTLNELRNNARIIGGLDRRSAWVARNLYRRAVDGEISTTGAKVAELSKLLENAYRDVNIAFANEVSLVAAHFGLDVREIIALANKHPRVNILRPGAGVGGHCIPVDPWFVHEAAPELTPLIAAARKVNDGKPAWVARQILGLASQRGDKSVALLGLAYKADIGDLRESPAVDVAELVAREFAGDILIADPFIDELPPALARFRNVRLAPTAEALDGAGLVALLCAHSSFMNLAPDALAGKTIVDPAGILPADIAAVLDTAAGSFAAVSCARAS